MASAGDRVVTPTNPQDGAGAYAVYESTNETPAQGARQAAMLVKQVDDSGNTLGGTGASADQVQGNVAHDAVDSGNPVKIGGKASTSLPSAVANADRVDAYFDERGRLGAFLPSVGYFASVTLTRTNDTSAYTANDVMGAATGSTAALEFTNVGPSGQSVMITSAVLEIDASAIISGETSYTLHLYSVTPPSGLGDNAAFDLPTGDRASYLGSINLGTPADIGSTLWVETHQINKQVRLAGTSLFGYLVTAGAYTPTALRVHVIKLHTVAL